MVAWGALFSSSSPLWAPLSLVRTGFAGPLVVRSEDFEGGARGGFYGGVGDERAWGSGSEVTGDANGDCL